MDVSDIARMLSGRIDQLVPEILPGAVKAGHEWQVGSIAGERGKSMSIHSSGPRAGVWCDFSNQNFKGDALDLVAFVLFGGDKKRAVAWAKSWLGIDGMDPQRLKTQRAKIKAQARRQDEQAAALAERRTRQARAIWLNSSPKLSGTAVDLYLMGRGISIDDLPKPPGAIRFASRLKYFDPRSRAESMWPAMVAAIVDGEGKICAAHRTYLHQARPGLYLKAPVVNPKLTLGSYGGGSIPLSRGASGKPIKDAPDGDVIILTEGIEDGLTLSICLPEYRVHAAISVGNFQNVRLPQNITDVIIAADNDAAGSQAARSLQSAIDVFSGQGRQVFLARPPEGKDFNEMLLSGGDVVVRRG